MLQAQLQRSDTSVIKPDLSRGQGMKVWRTVSGIVFCILYVLTFPPPLLRWFAILMQPIL